MTSAQASMAADLRAQEAEVRDAADAPSTTFPASVSASAVPAQRATVYEVSLAKGVCGFGIYFTAAADGAAMVDPTKPFYRLPDDTDAPGEASGVIAPGDRLLAINRSSVERWAFQQVVEELRRTPLGDVTLRFARVSPPQQQQHKEEQVEEEEEEPNMPAVTSADESADGDKQAKRVRWKLFDFGGASPAAAPPPSSHEEAMTRSAAMEELLVDMESKIRALEAAVEREKKCRFLAEKKNILYRNALRSLSDENAQLRYHAAIEAHARDAAQRFQRGLQLSI